MPAARAIATAAAGRLASWMRPSAASSSATKLWAPNERRFTPPASHASSRAGRTDSGLASRVNSASAAISNAARSAVITRAKCRAESADGVPPPKNTEWNGPGAAGARRPASSSIPDSQRSTAADDSAPLEKSQ